MNYLKGVLGFKGERGYSAYEVAVNNGYVGTEQDWLATLGTASNFSESKTEYTSTTVGQTEFDLPSAYTSNSFIDVYVEGEKLRASEYAPDTTNNKIVLTTGLDVIGTNVEVVVLTMASNSLPIVETINSDSTNDTTPSAKAVYDLVNPIGVDVEELKTTTQDTDNALNNLISDVNEKYESSNITTVTGSIQGINIGETKTADINYPSGFNKDNTIIVSAMESSNSVYYYTKDLEQTASGFPSISMVALTDSTIRVWMKNTSSSSARIGYYKLTLLKK